MNKTRFRVVVALALLAFIAMPVLAKEITVRGRLQKTVEAGGWLIVTDKEKYLILNAKDFQNESWFRERTDVEAVGETKTDVMTTYMEGTPFEVRTLRAVEQGGTAVATGAKTGTKVMVSGDSIVQAQPDTAVIMLSVVTQARRALDAQQENATRSDAVVRALKNAVGAGAEVKTSGYSLQPQRVYKENMPPTITGYEARNSVIVTLSDLSRVGPVIDAAAQVGANDISGISFTLRQDRPARDEALRQATREALSKAQVIATALGGRIVRIVEVQEEGTVRPLPKYEADVQSLRMAAPATPIEVGTLDVTSRVQLVAEVEVG
ncbi:MAG TPA: SIMPL domain-containing protein [Pyrinomonadaceae bacterium]|nr:SIMPL domain-containing protein [Pyrinomonadaceae bacterium]